FDASVLQRSEKVKVSRGSSAGFQLPQDNLALGRRKSEGEQRNVNGIPTHSHAKTVPHALFLVRVVSLWPHVVCPAVILQMGHGDESCGHRADSTSGAYVHVDPVSGIYFHRHGSRQFTDESLQVGV